ncbi:MAG: methyltransferase domain-containing protein [Candidatus Paceibacterota bacterium]
MFANPLKILKALGLKENDIVADLGAGTGHYTMIAGALVPKGKVYAVEVQKDFLGTIKSRIEDLHASNIEIIWGNVEKIGGTKIKDGIVDAVIASNILFQVEEKENFIKEVDRILKPKGKVLLIDWAEDSLMKGTKILPKGKAREMLEQKGFFLDREIDAGNHHYGMILRKQ